MASLSVNLEEGNKNIPDHENVRSGTDPTNFVMRRMWPNSRVIASRTKKVYRKEMQIEAKYIQGEEKHQQEFLPQ